MESIRFGAVQTCICLLLCMYKGNDKIMKKLIPLSLILLVPFGGGTLLQMFGSGAVKTAGYMIMSYGTLITMILVFVIGMIMMVTGKLSDNDKDTDGSHISKIKMESSKPIEPSDEELDIAALEEERKLNDINSSVKYENKRKYAEYVADKSAEAYRNSSKKTKILGWFYFAFLMITVSLSLILFFAGINVGGLICFGLFMGTILISLIVVVIISKRGLSTSDVRRNPDEWVVVKATVKSCVLSSLSSVGVQHRRYYETQRITDTTYKITATVEGKEYHGYSKTFHGEGTVVDILISAKGDKDKMHIL